MSDSMISGQSGYVNPKRLGWQPDRLRDRTLPPHDGGGINHSLLAPQLIEMPKQNAERYYLASELRAAIVALNLARVSIRHIPNCLFCAVVWGAK